MKQFSLRTNIIILIMCCINVLGSKWKYKNKGQWDKLPNTACSGVRQSPIAINEKNVEYWDGLKPITIKHGDSKLKTLSNTGYTLKITMSSKTSITFGDDGQLTPVAMHWHWGSDDSKGSEHSLYGKFYPLEGHLVCYNSKEYKTVKSALVSPRGLYVLGVFYEIGNKNDKLGKLLNKISASFKKNDVYPLNASDALPGDLERYYRYSGSLTTPPCTENVIWTVLETKLTISEKQMEQFRSLKFDTNNGGSNMINNFRPVVTLTAKSNYLKRVVYSSFKGSSKPIFTVFDVTLLLLLTLILK